MSFPFSVWFSGITQMCKHAMMVTRTCTTQPEQKRATKSRSNEIQRNSSFKRCMLRHTFKGNTSTPAPTSSWRCCSWRWWWRGRHRVTTGHLRIHWWLLRDRGRIGHVLWRRRVMLTACAAVRMRIPRWWLRRGWRMGVAVVITVVTWRRLLIIARCSEKAAN